MTLRHLSSQVVTDGVTITGNGTPGNPLVAVGGGAVYASIAETNAGTETAKAVTPDGLSQSYAGTKSVNIVCFAPTANVSTGDGKAYLTIPEACNGMNLVRATAIVVTAGTTNATTIQIHNVTQAADMLSGLISIASGGTVATAGTIDTGNDDVATNDVLRVDVDSVSTTAPKGLIVIFEVRLPCPVKEDGCQQFVSVLFVITAETLWTLNLKVSVTTTKQQVTLTHFKTYKVVVLRKPN